MRIIFSVPITLGKTGPGVTFGHIWNALEKVGATRVHIPEGLDKAYPDGSFEYATLYDLYASVEEDLDCDVLVGTGGSCLSQIRAIQWNKEARETEYAKIATLWFSTHFDHAFPLLLQEYQSLGIPATPPPQDKFLKWKCRREQELSDLIIVPSEQCARTYEEHEECKGKVRVANFGVDSTKFHPDSEKERLPSDEHVVFLTAATNPVRKGMPYLFQAWDELMKDYHHRATLNYMGFKLPVPQKPFTDELGWIADDRVPRIMREADVFVHPSLEEGQALACLEAMASGLPVIATLESAAPMGPLKEEAFFQNRTLPVHENGIIVQARDNVGLLNAMEWMMEHPDQRIQMGKYARKTAEELTWERFGNRVIEIFKEATT